MKVTIAVDIELNVIVHRDEYKYVPVALTKYTMESLTRILALLKSVSSGRRIILGFSSKLRLMKAPYFLHLYTQGITKDI